jgi:hypothetical protein
LPGRIIRRIERGDGQFDFWTGWLPRFSARPVLACAIALAFCCALTVAIYSPPRLDRALASDDLLPQNQWAANAVSSLPPGVSSPDRSAWLGCTNPVTAPQSADSLFLSPEARAIPVALFQQD